MKFFKLLMLCVLCLLCACTPGYNSMETTNIYSQNKTLQDLSTIIYSNDELVEISQYNGTFYELNSRYPTQCVRNTNDNYRVSYLGVNEIAILTFDNTGKKIYGKVHSVSMSKSDFCDLTNGDTLEDVLELDPNGDYMFLFTGRNDVPRCSYHYTNDGYMLTILYDFDNIIIDIKCELV